MTESNAVTSSSRSVIRSRKCLLTVRDWLGSFAGFLELEIFFDGDRPGAAGIAVVRGDVPMVGTAVQTSGFRLFRACRQENSGAAALSGFGFRLRDEDPRGPAPPVWGAGADPRFGFAV
ncbi:hypothetical protein [Amycolatopsis orientalis]|uniref:hypothetical protein n=1 Tax=Amycolatopsis orientalis TaxID=31958 RepID=UPI0012698125|nr:hypothetical protein [Amycolatopsis orientalis]